MAKFDMSQALGNLENMSKPREFKPIEPMSLDPNPNQLTIDDGLASANNRTATTEAKPPRKNVKAPISKRQKGVYQTVRFSFEITPELKEKLNKRIAEIQLTTGKKVSASEIIRDALARDLREI